MHIPSHQAIRFFLLSFSTGLIVLLAGALIVLTLPKHTDSTVAQQSEATLSSDDLTKRPIHIHGVITSLGDHLFTIRVQSALHTELPESVTVHYTDGILSSVDTTQPPDPVSGKTPEAHEIDSAELRIGDIVDVTIGEDVTPDSAELYAKSVLQVL